MNTTITAPENSQVAIINNSIELFKSAPQILKDNQVRTQKALMVGNDILGQWAAAWNIQNEDQRMAALAVIDERSNKYMVNCSGALKQQKELRASITQMMDNFKSMFTEAENQIDKAKANTVPGKVQNNRDSYAHESFKISEKKRKVAEAIELKAKEAIQINADAEIRLSNKYNDYLLEKKNKLQNGFNSITLENFEEKSAKLRAYSPTIANEVITEFHLGLIGNYHTTDEIAQMIRVIVSSKLRDFSSNYTAELTLQRDELIDKLQSKKAELDDQKRLADEMAAAQKLASEAKTKSAKEAADKIAALAKVAQDKAAADQKERENAEATKLAADTEDAKRKAALVVDVKTQGEQTMAMFNKEAALAENIPVAESRQGYEITILHPVGFTQIFALWFEKEGKDLPVDKIGNTKLDQMKAWAEKYAQKTSTMIESKFLKYEESFKAINRKAKV